MSFAPEQVELLKAPLDRSHVKEREQSGRKLSYIEGWWVIAEANRIFGFDAWTRETLEIRCVSERERKIGRAPNQKDGWGVSYVAKVRVVAGGVTREGIGAGHGIDADLGLAHESAIKEAETDAMKRALMTFGNPFGLALYDKTQANVAFGQGGEQPAPQRGPAPKPNSANQLKKEDVWKEMEADIAQCGTTVSLARCYDTWAQRANRDGWPSSWVDPFEDTFEAAREELRKMEQRAIEEQGDAFPGDMPPMESYGLPGTNGNYRQASEGR